MYTKLPQIKKNSILIYKHTIVVLILSSSGIIIAGGTETGAIH